jgi:cyclophilin family peptidyl-prolyl cis-trans isomerase
MKRLVLTLMLSVLCSLLSSAQTRVEFYTTLGNFTVYMEDTLAPITAGNFISLVEQEYFDGIIFHRVIDNFMIQGGDPTGTGTGGPGYTIDDEFAPGLSNVQGTISMANSGPNTGGSQFFINLVNNTYLDHDKSPFTSKHPVFGHVEHNFNVVELIGQVDTDVNDRPTENVVMDSLRIVNPLSVRDREKRHAAVIYPNPITSESFFELDGEVRGKMFLNLLDLQGRLIARTPAIGDGPNPIGSYFESLKPGLYILELATPEGGIWRDQVLFD